MKRVLARALLAAGASLALSGCVAAVAIPVVAGGLLTKSRLDADRRAEERAAAASVEVAPTPADVAANVAEAPAPATTEPTAPALPPPPVLDAAQFGLPPDPQAARAPLSPLPPISDVAPAALPTGAAPIDPAGFGRFVQGAAAPGNDGARISALLENGGSLDDTRRPCHVQAPAVVIDLDPAGGIFDPASSGLPNPWLGDALTRLRTDGITVVWVSSLHEGFAPEVRLALARAGLDRFGADRLALVDSLAGRKQLVRSSLDHDLCVLAILGDERADFDELYTYLKDPAAAFPLEKLIGAGWFVASPFVTPPTAGDLAP